MEVLDTLSLLSTDATYEEKVKYYTNSLLPKSPYLSAELITDLNTFINTEFPGLDAGQKNRIEQLLSSDKNEKFITDILDICKPPKEHKKIIFAKYKELISNVKGYTPPQDAPLLLYCGELEKLVSLLKDVVATKPIKVSAKDILGTLNDFLYSQVSILPTPIQDDNSLKLELEQFKTGQTTTGGGLIIHKIFKRNNVPCLQKKRHYRKQAKRYSCKLPGERVQMDVCKIANNLYPQLELTALKSNKY